MPTPFRAPGPAATALGALALLLINVAIVAPLFAVEYSAYTGSNEGSFIAIARVMAEHPGEWQWWPFWAGGAPFETTYLPLQQWIVAGFTLMTGLSPARSFHIVTAAFYALGPLGAFWLGLALGGKRATSFLAALAYSCLSLSTLLVPAIQADAGGPLALRRLQALVFYGAAPQITALALLPIAIVCFHYALTTDRMKWKILAGMLTASVALSNAFGLVMLVIALFCWLLAYQRKLWWRGAPTVIAIGALSYCWISPWLSPRMLRAMLENAFTSGGDFRYGTASWIALATALAGFAMLAFFLRRSVLPAHLQFFLLFAYVPGVAVLIWYGWSIAVIPQAFRYHLDLDLALMLAFVFGMAEILRSCSKSIRIIAVPLVAAVLAFLAFHAGSYARELIRAVDPARLSECKIARWLDQNRPGERAFITGSSSFLYNVFTDNPQLHGAHEQHIANYFIRVAAFQIYSGMNADNRDAEYAVFWLKAFGAHAISVSGPKSTEYFKPFANSRKFEGVLPLLWREGDDSIYGVPARSRSLAHVMPAAAAPARQPLHGLDIEPVRAYVDALDDPRYPTAAFEWKSLSEAEIRAVVSPGEIVAVQITYAPGWEAYANGEPQPVRGDGIGQMIIETSCVGECLISLRYTGGFETQAARALSGAATLATLVLAWFDRRPMSRSAA